MISQGPYSHETLIQVQRHGPVPLLIGTDLQPHLGFLFLQMNPEGEATRIFW